MKITEICARDFNLAMTLNSGQVFHWEKAGRGFVGTIGDLPVYVEQNGTLLTLGGAPWPAPGTHALPRIVAHYFALDHRQCGVKVIAQVGEQRDIASGKDLQQHGGVAMDFRQALNFPFDIPLKRGRLQRVAGLFQELV